MKKIVLALALAAVTPAVLVAQENGNAYNQNNNEVIAPTTQTEPVSIANYGPEGKALALSDLALARIRAKHANEVKQEQTQKKTKPSKEEPTNTTPTASRPTANTYNPYTGREGHMMAPGNYVRDLKQQERQDTTPSYIREVDTIANNHHVVLDNRTTERSVKSRGSSFRRTVYEVASIIGQSLAQQAPYDK